MTLLIILAGLALAFLLVCAAIVAAGLRERLAPADVIVVLGCKVYPDGTPSPMLIGRLERGLEVWRAGLAPTIIVSGDGAAKEGVDEAAAMKAWLVGQGAPKDAVVTDPSGVNTHATAVFTASWMSANEASSVIGVSSYFHLPRIRFTLHRAGVSEVLSAPAGEFRWRDRIWIAREIAAWTKFLLKP